MVTPKIKNLIGALVTFVAGCTGIPLVHQLNNLVVKIFFGIITICCFVSFSFYLFDLIFGRDLK